jgi:guanylate kinase
MTDSVLPLAGPPERPLLVVVSAPSGAGKTTLCDRLLGEFSRMSYSVSCTTRPPRSGEIDGEDYHFLSADEFDRRARAGEFMEHAVVHANRYGTLRRTVVDALAAGRDVLMDIDVQGAGQIRRLVGGLPAGDLLRRAFVDIFIAPPSLEALRGRLVKRGLDAEDVIERRMRNARGEWAEAGAYRYYLVNDRLDAAYDALRAIVIAEHCRQA